MSDHDCGFPIIEYIASESPFEWGRKHGEKFAAPIAELVQIRKTLMQDKNPLIAGEKLEELAMIQWEETKKFDFDLSEELRGISEGSGLSQSDIVILNNYTDFRDIDLTEQGCTTVIKSVEDRLLAGQTWDMHESAKRFLCLIKVPETENTPESVVLSIVGCTGLMGVNRYGCMIGVNNINTDKAEAGIIWPCLVRKVLKSKDTLQMEELLTHAKVTSGHNYMISDAQLGQMHEISPAASDRLANIEVESNDVIIHTNHCLGESVQKLETPTALNSTTHIRYDLTEKKISAVKTRDDLYALFTDHENYPKSICSHFQSGKQDPSMTCGGGVGDFKTMDFVFWRGCPEYDDNFVKYHYQLNPTGSGPFFKEVK